MNVRQNTKGILVKFILFDFLIEIILSGFIIPVFDCFGPDASLAYQYYCMIYVIFCHAVNVITDRYICQKSQI